MLPIACGPAVNESERLALARVQASLIGAAGDGLWRLLTNLRFSANQERQADEIDMVAIGPPGVRVIEVKHWSADWISRNEHVVDQAANLVTHKAKRIGTTLRAELPDLPHVDGVFLVTHPAAPADELSKVVRGARFFTLKSCLQAAGADARHQVLSDAEILFAASSLAPRSKIASEGELRRLGKYARLELQTPKAERFRRVFRGEHATSKRRVFLHFYDWSASEEPRGTAEAKAQREFQALDRLYRYAGTWAPRIVDSFQAAPGYHDEMAFFAVADPDAPSIADRAADPSWDTAARLSFARSAVCALRDLHAADGGAMLHRGLTPRSILVRHDNTPILTDFQYARIPSDVTVSEVTASSGTTEERWDDVTAPEVRAQGRGAAERSSDVYALCASLQGLFHGRDDEDSREAAATLDRGASEDMYGRSSLDELNHALSLQLGQSPPQPPPPPARYWTEGQEVDFAGHRYRIVSKLGQGGLGTSFKVDETDHKSQAIGTYVGKVIHERENGERVLSAHKRARPHLDHAALCTVYQVAPDWGENAFAVVMAWIEGEPISEYAGLLRELAEDHEDESEEALAIRWLRTACGALQELHRNGLVHGDVSPRNLLLASGDVVLTDFDCVTRIGEVSEMPGTVMYCAPYRGQRQAADPSDDIYALAASVFRVLLAQEPFMHGGVPDKTRGLSWEGAERSDFPALAPFLDQATAADPERRFADASDALQALEAAGGSDRAVAGEPSTAERDAPSVPPAAGTPPEPRSAAAAPGSATAAAPSSDAYRGRGAASAVQVHRWITLAALAVAFSVSCLAVIVGDRPVSRVLFFGGVDGDLVGETRYLPRRAGRIEPLRLLVDEVILGPRAREHASALPISTEVRFLALGSDTLYVDLSAAALLDESGAELQGADRLQALASTLLFNTPWLRRVWLFVDGQIPDYEAARDGWVRACC